MSLPNDLRPRNWHCNRLLSAILDEHDAREAFGNVLANIQILPALLGRSLLDLPTAPCPASSKLKSKRNGSLSGKNVKQTPQKKTQQKKFENRRHVFDTKTVIKCYLNAKII